MTRLIVIIVTAVTAAYIAAIILGHDVRWRTERDPDIDRVVGDTLDTQPDRATLESDGDVRFADGSMLRITWRERQAKHVPEPPYGKAYERLRREARGGDADAAFALYEILSEKCKGAPVTLRELNDAIELVYQAHTIEIPGYDRRARITNPESVDNFIANLQTAYESCLGITEKQKSEAAKWLELAATNGHSYARLEYAATHKVLDLAIRHLELSWLDGEAEALRLLEERYQERYNDGLDPLDRIRSYAALYAYSALQASGFEDHGAIAKRRIERVKRRLKESTNTLPADDSENGAEMAKDMIRDNPKCCYEM